MLEYALIENIQRDDQNPIEEAEGYLLLSNKYNLTQNQIAKKVGKNRSTITNALRILKLPKEIQKSIKDNQLSSGHGRALLKLRGISSKNSMINLFKKTINNNLSVRELESITSNLINNKKNLSKPKKKKHYTLLMNIESSLISIFGTKVQIKKNKGNKGKISISFYSNDDLNRILELISSIK